MIGAGVGAGLGTAMLSLALANAVPPPTDYDPDSGLPPGGYWAPGEAPAVAPADGETELLVAYILLPLGTLATASAAPMLWATAPGHCQERMESLGYNPNPEQCRGLWIYNLIRISYGAAEVVTGAVFLGMGLNRKKKHKEWKRRRFQQAAIPRISLVPQRRGSSVGLSWSF